MRSEQSKTEIRRDRAQRGAYRLLSVGCVAGLVIASVGLIRIRAQESFPLPAVNPPGAKASAPATAAAPVSQPPGDTPADPNQPQVARQCADLLKMAAELKTEVDKTTKDTLSVAVVRKAGEIEQLARKVRSGTNKNETMTH